MKRLVKIRVEKENTDDDILSVTLPFEMTMSTTVLELKNQIRNNINLPNQIVTESIFNNVRELKNKDILLTSQNLHYLLIVK
jgi:hypothetical protein